MRCKSCQAVLQDHEATRKMENSQEYADLCDDCYEGISDDVELIEVSLDHLEYIERQNRWNEE